MIYKNMVRPAIVIQYGSRSSDKGTREEDGGNIALAGI